MALRGTAVGLVDQRLKGTVEGLDVVGAGVAPDGVAAPDDVVE
jgi:hypothetical protein